VTPTTKEATGTISKPFRKFPSNTLGKHIKELEKTATLDTAHMLLTLLM